MAKVRAETVPNDGLDDETRAEAEEFARLNQAAGGELFGVIDELRGSAGASGVTCIVTRTAPVDKAGYVGTLSISEFTREKIKAMYGAGRYMVQIKGPKGFLPGGGPVQIAETSNENATAARPGGDIMQFFEMMEKRREQERKEDADRRWRLLELAVPALGTALAALLGRSQGPDVATLITALKPAPAPTMMELTQSLANIKALSNDSSKESSMDQFLKMIEAVKDFSDSGESGGKGESNWIDLVRDLIKVAPEALRPVLEARMAQMQGVTGAAMPSASAPLAKPAAASGTAAPRVAQPATPNSVGGAADSSATNGTGEANMLELFKPAIKEKLRIVAGWAAANRDPVMYAQVFCDDVGEQIAKYLPQAQALEYLRNEKWFDYVTEWEPALQAHHEWCEHFRNELIEIVSLTDEPDDKEEKPTDAAAV